MANVKKLKFAVKALEERGAKAAKKEKGAGDFLFSVPDEPAKKGDRLKAPAVIKGGTESTVQKIYDTAKKQRTPTYPEAKEPVFGKADPALTKEVVPQVARPDLLPPRSGKDGKMPNNNRIAQLSENSGAIADKLAADLLGMEDPRLHFYSTGSVIQGLSDKGGLSLPEANQFMTDWSGQGAATSPRTKTPTNLRNASYLMYRQAQDDPLTAAKRKAEGNKPGFPMMGMHADLADQFAKGTVDPWRNTKPSFFQPNWAGNMEAGSTVDTHNIRAVLDAYDQLNPGGLQRDWFTSADAYDKYISEGGFPKEGTLPVGDIADSLGSLMVDKRKAQVEYPAFNDINTLIGQRLGTSPAEAQEDLWFGKGRRTNLSSPRMTIPDLLNAQIEATARATGLAPEIVLRLWAQRKIPLASNEEDNNMPGASATA